MKKIVKILYLSYHSLFPSRVASCRFDPTCSQYMLDATDKYGALKGLMLTLKRVTSCHPLSKKPYFDPA